jgi:hypothetical protein
MWALRRSPRGSLPLAGRSRSSRAAPTEGSHLGPFEAQDSTADRPTRQVNPSTYQPRQKIRVRARRNVFGSLRPDRIERRAPRIGGGSRPGTAPRRCKTSCRHFSGRSSGARRLRHTGHSQPWTRRDSRRGRRRRSCEMHCRKRARRTSAARRVRTARSELWRLHESPGHSRPHRCETSSDAGASPPRAGRSCRTCSRPRRRWSPIRV